jgi:hypothetical protein
MSERVGISKKQRFDVFKRDGFVCMYCGAHPPAVLLEADHIHPVADGGTNDIDNLVTACENCNRGKGAGLLSNVPQSLAEKAEMVAEREAQLAAYYEILQGAKDRRDAEMWAIAQIFMERWAKTSMLRTNLSSISMFLKRLDFFEVQEAMEIATDKVNYESACFRYFAGVCWSKIKKAEGDQ